MQNFIELTVERSPARVSWLVMLGKTVIAARDTKAEAEELKRELETKYG